MTTRKELQQVFQEVKKSAGLDFALTRGTCCQTCTWQEIADKYGKGATGVWLKWYPRGMNSSAWTGEGWHYVAHYLSEDQKQLVYNTLTQHFRVEWDFSASKCIKIYL